MPPETPAQAWLLVARAEVEQELGRPRIQQRCSDHTVLPCAVRQREMDYAYQRLEAVLTQFSMDILDRIFVN